MLAQSHWGSLPSPVLALAFRSLPLTSKLHCERVCTAWSQVSLMAHCSLYTHLCCMTRWPERNRHPMTENPDRSQLTLRLPTCEARRLQMLQWLSRRLRSISFLRLSSFCGSDPVQADLLRLIFANSDAAASTLPELSLRLHEDALWDDRAQDILTSLCKDLEVCVRQTAHIEVISYFAGLKSLKLTGQYSWEESVLPECLTALDRLQTLSVENFSSIPEAFSGLARLTHLRFSTHEESGQLDLSKCTQLQRLQIHATQHSQRLALLPKGDFVSLRFLEVGDGNRIHQLEAAVQLTSLDLHISPTQAVCWPTTLTALKCLQLDCLYEDAPVVQEFLLHPNWQHYTNLEMIKLNHCSLEDTGAMPAWFSSLKQLTHLDLPSSTDFAFDRCYRDFSQLKHLDLSCYASKVGPDVVVLSYMPNLTYLSFDDMSDHKDHPDLLDLDVALRDDTIRWLDALALAIETSCMQPSRLIRVDPSEFWYIWQAEP